MKYDIIIIGSGLGGLQCAYILAKQGRRVCVLEKELHPGGCMQSYRRKGIALDTGLHYVGGLAPGNSLYPHHRLTSYGFMIYRLYSLVKFMLVYVEIGNLE